MTNNKAIDTKEKPTKTGAVELTEENLNQIQGGGASHKNWIQLPSFSNPLSPSPKGQGRNVSDTGRKD